MTLEKALEVLARRYNYLKEKGHLREEGAKEYRGAEARALARLALYVTACQAYLMMDVPEVEVEGTLSPSGMDLIQLYGIWKKEILENQRKMRQFQDSSWRAWRYYSHSGGI